MEVSGRGERGYPPFTRRDSVAGVLFSWWYCSCCGGAAVLRWHACARFSWVVDSGDPHRVLLHLVAKLERDAIDGMPMALIDSTSPNSVMPSSAASCCFLIGHTALFTCFWVTRLRSLAPPRVCFELKSTSKSDSSGMPAAL